MSPHKRRRRMISSSSVARSPQKMKVPKEELGEEDLVEELHDELEEAGELGDGVGITVDDSVAEGEILHEEIIHEGDLVDEDVELEYVEEETEVPHMAHEVVMDGDIVEEYVEVEAAPDDDIATESLVALSRGPSNQHKTVRDFLRQTVQLNAKVRPRILRRTVNLQHEDYEEESMSRNQVLHTKFPVPSTTKPLLPVAIAGSSQPHQQQRNWREEQKRMLEIYEIYDSLPDNMRENFKQLLESRGEKVPVFRRNIPKKPGFGSLYPHPRMMVPRTPVRERSLKESHGGETVTVDTGDGQRTVIMRDASDETATFPEGTQFVMTNSRGEQPRLMALVPLESEAAEHEKAHVSVDPSELVDMPELECNPEGEDEQIESESVTARDPHIDVEGYGSDDGDDDRNIRTGIDYILDSEGEDDAVFSEIRLAQMQPPTRRLTRDNVLGSRRVILPEMRADVFGSIDVRHFGARQIDKHAPEARFCPGCKLTLKRSVYYHHTRMIKKFGVCNMFTPKRFPCGEEGCKERLGTVEKLCEHMWQIHGAPTNIKTKTFEDETEFEVFLRELEGKGGNFRMSRGNKMIKAGLVQYFRCNRMQSVARDKTMRMCDELQAGMFGSSDHIAKEEDPFTTTISTKPHLRTEEACTAFFRKAFLQDGRIEVRYCDHHLHDDERIRLPPSVKERIHEMNAKKLPPAVIIMVLQSERERYCLRDSAVERRILALTPKDISNVLSLTGKGRKKLNFQRRNLEVQSNQSTQRTESLETESQPSVIGQPDAQGSRIPNGDDHLEEETDQTVEGLDKQREDERLEEAVSWVSEQELSELEQRMLEKYEENHDIILTDFQKMRRLENKKRHKRESIRHKVFTLGRYIKTPHFGDLDEENLILVNDMLKNVISICEDSQKNQSSWQGGVSKRKKGENEEKSSGRRIGQEEEDGVLEVDVEDPHINMDMVSEVSAVEHSVQQEIHSSALSLGTPSPTKKRGRGRPRKYELTRVKEEELESSCISSGDTASSYITPTPGIPSVSRTGRVIKPKIIQDL